MSNVILHTYGIKGPGSIFLRGGLLITYLCRVVSPLPDIYRIISSVQIIPQRHKRFILIVSMVRLDIPAFRDASSLTPLSVISSIRIWYSFELASTFIKWFLIGRTSRRRSRVVTVKIKTFCCWQVSLSSLLIVNYWQIWSYSVSYMLDSDSLFHSVSL